MSMAGHQLTPFEHVLLGLICLSPSSGYDLKRRFAATPLGVYQPSSGSLYPALRRLEAKGLIGSIAPNGASESARHRRAYEPTPAGRTVSLAWLRTPIEPATVARDLGLHLMRFVMMEHAFSRDEVLGFLESLRDTLAAFVAGLEQYAAVAPVDFRHPSLALDHGVVVYRASLQWTEHAIGVLRAAAASPA